MQPILYYFSLGESMISEEVLRRYPIFANLSEDQLREIALISEQVSYAAGDQIVHEGDTAVSLYIILSGQANVAIETNLASATHSDIGLVSEGSLVGWAGLLTDKRSASVYAQSDVSAIAVDGNELREMLNSDCDMGYKIMRHLACTIYEHLRFTNYQLVSLN